MFEGEKTFIFWIGLIILGLASYVLFSTLWEVVGMYAQGYGGIYYRGLVPPLFGGVVFLLIGLYMMRSGVRMKESQDSGTKNNSEPKPSKPNDPNLLATRIGALLDFYSDRAVAHASFVVASIFGLVTLSAIIQQLEPRNMLFVWLSTPLFFAFSYAGYWALVRFNYYADISEKLTLGLEGNSTLSTVDLPAEKQTLKEYMQKQYSLQRIALLPKKISPKYTRILLPSSYWFITTWLGLVAYSGIMKFDLRKWSVWGLILGALMLLLVVVPLALIYQKKNQVL